MSNMANFLKHLQSLYELELYTNLLEICSLSVTACEQKPDLFSLPNKFQINFYYAEALYHTQQYARAEYVYEQIVQMRKNVIKNKNANKVVDVALLDAIASDIEIKYKLYLCCMKLDKKAAAITVLESIPARLRTPKINVALGKLYKCKGQQRQAVTCFKEVLRDCPLALEAVNELLKLGVKGVEVNSLMVEVTSEIPWLNIWLKAQAQLNAKEFTNAIQTFKSMDTNGLLRDNTTLLINMGYCYHYLCEDPKAIAVLQRAFKLNPRLMQGKDLLSNLLVHSGNKDHISELETMLPNTDVSLWSTEQFVVFGNYLYSSKKYEKAVFYAHQAIMLNKRNVEAFFLKAMTLCQLKKYVEASEHCIEALQICSYRYDLHKCLVDCYIQTNRLKEAETMAVNACKQLNYSAQSYLLHATAIMKDPLSSNRSLRRILGKAALQDKNNTTDAVYMLVEYLEQEQEYEEAAQLLVKYIERFPSSRAYQLLGDCYFNLHKDDEAFDQYKIALKLDPKNQRALEGLNNIGRTTSGSKRDSYYSCVGESSYNSQGTNASDEADPESDTDHIGSILFT